MRAAFSTLLAAAARDNKRILLLTGDHGYALFDEFRRACQTAIRKVLNNNPVYANERTGNPP